YHRPPQCRESIRGTETERSVVRTLRPRIEGTECCKCHSEHDCPGARKMDISSRLRHHREVNTSKNHHHRQSVCCLGKQRMPIPHSQCIHASTSSALLPKSGCRVSKP